MKAYKLVKLLHGWFVREGRVGSRGWGSFICHDDDDGLQLAAGCWQMQLQNEGEDVIATQYMKFYTHIR